MPIRIEPTQTPPAFPDQWEGERQRETLLRTRMLDGEWGDDLEEAVRRHVGESRLEGWKGYDMSANPFKVITRSLSVLYDRPPTIRAADGDLAGFSERTEDDTPGVLERAGLWPIQQRLQARVIGCRQYLVRVTVTTRPDGDPEARFRLVNPAFVIAWSLPDAPDVPVAIAEARLRKRPGTQSEEYVWTWDYLDIRDPDDPVYRVHLHGSDRSKVDRGEFLGVDITDQVLGEQLSGRAYPYRFADGTPHLPYVLYHAERGHGCLWTPFEGRELVRGSINLAVGWSFWYHCFRDSSWPQRWMLNAMPAGAQVDSADGGEARSHVVADPAAVLILQLITPEGGAQVGQWKAGADMGTMTEALGEYGKRLSEDAGISAADVQRESGNARSGYAISLTNSGKREAQRRFAEPFAWADCRLLAITAAMCNRVGGTAFPEDGYTVEYAEIPMSPDEMRARDEHVARMLELGLMTELEAYMQTHPGVSRAQAEGELAAIKAQRADRLATEPAGEALGKLPLAAQQLALARERAVTAGDTELAEKLGRKIDGLLNQIDTEEDTDAD